MHGMVQSGTVSQRRQRNLRRLDQEYEQVTVTDGDDIGSNRSPNQTLL